MTTAQEAPKGAPGHGYGTRVTDPDPHRATGLVGGGRPTEPGAPLTAPIHFNSTYRFGGDVGYGRSGNPTWHAFEEVLGDVEGGEAVAFASGLAACTAVLDLVPLGGAVVAPRRLYMGTMLQLRERVTEGRIELRLVESTDTAAIVAAAEGAALVWLESPTNPLLEVIDLRAVANARPQGTLLVVDSTFATPVVQRPLELGADIVVHSATKGIGGHADLLMGAVVARPDLAERVRSRREGYGAVPGTMEAFLALRGLRTLDVRMERAQRSAQAIAEFLSSHPAVRTVHYPGLPDDPGHALARTQMDGFGSMVSFVPAGGEQAAQRLCAATRVFANATSLGGVESLIEWRGRHETERSMGTPGDLVRISVGIEHGEDLIADLDRALAADA